MPPLSEKQFRAQAKPIKGLSQQVRERRLASEFGTPGKPSNKGAEKRLDHLSQVLKKQEKKTGKAPKAGKPSAGLLNTVIGALIFLIKKARHKALKEGNTALAEELDQLSNSLQGHRDHAEQILGKLESNQKCYAEFSERYAELAGIPEDQCSPEQRQEMNDIARAAGELRTENQGLEEGLDDIRNQVHGIDRRATDLIKDPTQARKDAGEAIKAVDEKQDKDPGATPVPKPGGMSGG